MSKAEKRYFHLYAQMGGGKGGAPKYVRLFDLIDKQIEYDDEAVKKGGFNSTDKAFLNEKIQESLHILYLNKSKKAELELQLSYIPRLMERNLHTELQKRLKKARQLAEEQADFSVLLDIIQLEKKLIISKVEKDIYVKIKALIIEENKVRQQLNSTLDYQNLRIEIDILRSKDVRLTKPENKILFEQFTTSPLLDADPTSLPINAQANFHRIKCIVYQYAGKHDKAYTHAQALVALFDDNKQFKGNNLFEYKRSLCLFSELCYISGNYDEIPDMMDKIEAIPIKSEDGDTEVFKTVCLFGLLYALVKADREVGLKYIHKIETLWDKHAPNIRVRRQLSYFYNIMIFFSLFSEWKEADKWLEKILNFGRTNAKKDVQTAARIWKLVVGCELEPEELDNHIQRAFRYLTRNNQYGETEKHILEAFRGLHKSIEKKEKQQAWQKLHDYLTIRLNKQERSTHFVGMEELHLWCASKLEGLTIAELMRKRER